MPYNCGRFRGTLLLFLSILSGQVLVGRNVLVLKVFGTKQESISYKGVRVIRSKNCAAVAVFS